MADGNKHYAILDLQDAYFPVLPDEGSRDITSFSGEVSLYRFRRLPFWLSYSSAIFPDKIAQLLAPLIKQGWVKNYLDDATL